MHFILMETINTLLNHTIYLILTIINYSFNYCLLYNQFLFIQHFRVSIYQVIFITFIYNISYKHFFLSLFDDFKPKLKKLKKLKKKKYIIHR